MSTQNFYGGLSAAADLTGKQYHIVRLSAAYTTNQASLATDINIAGVLQNKPSTNEHASVAFEGRGKVVAGAAINANAWITANSSGRATSVLSGLASMVVGRALEAAGADGDIIDVMYGKPFPWPNIAI